MVQEYGFNKAKIKNLQKRGKWTSKVGRAEERRKERERRRPLSHIMCVCFMSSERCWCSDVLRAHVNQKKNCLTNKKTRWRITKTRTRRESDGDETFFGFAAGMKSELFILVENLCVCLISRSSSSCSSSVNENGSSWLPHSGGHHYFFNYAVTTRKSQESFFFEFLIRRVD